MRTVRCTTLGINPPIRRFGRAIAMRPYFASLLLVFTGWVVAGEQSAPSLATLAADPDLFLRIARQAQKWDEPAEPLRIVGPIHFVGTQGLGVYLITGTEGHIVLNTGMPGSGPMIEASIRKLGFNPRDVRILLTNHAHIDHVGDHAYLKRATGAQVAMIAEEVGALAAGGAFDPQYGTAKGFLYAPVATDRVLRDGEKVSLGNIAMTAHHTPGHSLGSVTWTMTVHADGRDYAVVFPDGLGINPGFRVAVNPQFPGREAHYRATFAKLEAMKPDIWISAHNADMDFDAKRVRAATEGTRAWIDPEGYRKFLATNRERLETTVAAERSAVATTAAPAAAVAGTGSTAGTPAALPPLPTIPPGADMIRLKTGTVLFGRLKSASYGMLLFDLVGVGDTEIKIREVTQLVASSADFELDMNGKDRQTGRIGAGTTAGEFVFTPENGTPGTLALADVVKVKRVELKLLERLDGILGAGFGYSSGTDSQQLSMISYGTYSAGSYRLTGYYGLVMADAPGQSLQTVRMEGGLGGQVSFGGKWLALQYFLYQEIPVMGVNSRYASITGGGWRLVHNPRMDLDIGTGIVVQRENPAGGPARDAQYELPIVFGLQYGFPKYQSRFGLNSVFYHSLSDADRNRLDVRMSLTHELFTNFTFGLEVLYNWDSDPIAPGAEDSSTTATFQAGYKF
jgi:metallo-beta-lactamase class B